MAKQGMKRPEEIHIKKKNQVPPVPEISGKAKSTGKHANNVIKGTASPSLKVYHEGKGQTEKPISQAYKEIDNDLARDNFENDITSADLQDM